MLEIVLTRQKCGEDIITNISPTENVGTVPIYKN